MNRFIAPLAVVLALVVASAAQAAPGKALREAAQSGMITPGGVFDGR